MNQQKHQSLLEIVNLIVSVFLESHLNEYFLVDHALAAQIPVKVEYILKANSNLYYLALV